MLIAISAVTVDISLPAVPAMVSSLGTTLSLGQQIVGLFMIGMSFGQIPSGLAADRYGRMPTIYTGMTLFVIAAGVAAMASNIEVLLFARFIQGIAAAPAMVVARAIVRDISSGREAARLISLMTMIFTAAPVIAPSIGALLVAHWSWRAPFIVIVLAALLLLVAIRCNLVETHVPDKSQKPLRQLVTSFKEYFSHRQSVFALLLLILIPAGFLSVIATSAALIVEIYGFTIKQFGLIFATAGLSILMGSAVNRWLVTRYDSLQLVKLGTALIFVASAQLGIIAWMNAAPLWWLWSCVCLYMFTVAILAANATVLALDPLPRIAGVASSIIGTSQNLLGAAGAILAALIFNGTVRNAVIIMAISGILTTIVYLLRDWIAPNMAYNTDD